MSGFSIVVAVVLYYFAPNYPSQQFMGLCVTIALLLSIFHIGGFGVDNKLKTIFLRHSCIFIIGYLIVFFQRAIDYSIGIIDVDSFNVEELLWANAPSVVSKACALSLVGISSFINGYNNFKCNRFAPSKYDYRFKYKHELVLLGILLLIVYGIISGIGNFSKKEEDYNIGFLMVAQAVLLAVIVIYAYEYKIKINCKRFTWWYFLYPLFLIIFYLVLYLATGNRGGAIKVCLMLLAAYVYIKQDKVNYKRVLLFFAIGAISMTVIGIIRTMESKDINAVNELITATETISPFTVELSGSVNTVHVALANYPSKQNFNYGTSFIEGFTVLVPGLSRILHIGDNSGVILTKHYFGGSIPDWGWGLGSSAVADAYISFGLIGTIIVFLLFGKFIRYLEYGTFVIEKSPLFLVLSFCVYSQLISLCRGPFSILFLSWDYAFVLVFVCSVRRLKFST